MEKELFEFLDNLDDFRSSDHFDFFLLIKEAKNSLQICCDNYFELVNKLKYHNSKEIESRLWDTNSAFRNRLQKQLSRMLSNYLNSVKSHIDYSRAELFCKINQNKEVKKKYDDLFKSYNILNPSHQFIIDLRNYSCHRSIIKLGTELKYNIEWTEPQKSVYILKSNLLEWNGWNSNSKIFIDHYYDRIPLNEILNTFHANYEAFQKQIFLLIMLVNQDYINELLFKIKILYSNAISVNMTHALPYSNAYIKYIEKCFLKAKTLLN
ncbi:MAG: hypothetical protein RI943_352 [Bacteroidota bacterium]|jgi:hypothetical protein